MNLSRAEILASGFVQGVGFRYFVVKQAEWLGLKGFTENLFSGEVLTVVEGEKSMIEELHKQIKIGPSRAQVRNVFIKWCNYKNEFTKFEIKY
ncbi:MAG: acylphosphatase [Ignavibacteria bacterium]|nr:MAG: acylphosphatase [Ignavibacteria bacterium]KAF0161520.1 MAG: acylphosphatase [Ignavibacteria bacterium]